MTRILATLLLVGLVWQPAFLMAQSDLKFEQLPGFSSYQRVSRASRTLGRGQRVTGIEWAADGNSVAFTRGDEKEQLLFADKLIRAYEATPAYEAPESAPARRRSPVGRALQRTVEISPDEKWQAVYKDFNVVIKPTEGNEGGTIQVTTGGNDRLRFGTGCWVYGEELSQSEAMWWSPDSQRLVFYEIDETQMKDYFLTTNNTSLYTEVQAVRYPKAGDPNPRVSLHVYDMTTGKTRKFEIDGEPTQYLYNVQFAPGGEELLVNQTNRQQNILNVLAVNVETGKVRSVVREEQDTWQENEPGMRFLKDGKRFVWETERTGWKHFELRSLDGELLNPLSPATEFACERIVKVDEENGFFYYTAYSDLNPYNEQLHRVKLDGTEHVRITTSPLHHTSFDISPFNNFVIAVREQVNIPPTTAVYSCEDGSEVVKLVESTDEDAKELGLVPPQLFSFIADDGKTEIYGTLHFPSKFNPNRKYPLLIDVYGGPQSRGFSNRYRPANAVCELGFLVAKIGNRGTAGRGKAFESATYLNLGGPDLQDQTDGVKYLSQRPYVDGDRVGIYGHSYGGYMSALAILRHPDVFHVAVSGAPVTDWKNYDTIYTERYMQTPQLNSDGYQQGSCLSYVENLKGKLLLVHGLIDDNVHPSNTWQLAKGLQSANQRFDMMIYPGFKHGVRSTYNSLRWEYFYRYLNPSVN